MTNVPEPPPGAASVAEVGSDVATVEVVDRQRKRKMDVRRWQVFAVEALREIRAAEASGSRPGSSAAASPDDEPANTTATIAFVGERVIRRLNNDFRGKNAVTDVLSFPNEHDADGLVPSAADYLGDVVICVAQAERQAAENDLSFDEETAQLILHGLIHLFGYDHATDSGEMNRFELSLRARLGVG